MENKEVENWDSFLAPYEQAVEELKVKLKGIRKQYRDENTHAPIEFITGRVKTKESILEKAEVRDIDLTRLEQDVQDIAGLRI
ncbi:MAG TPA: GTP pyrophosphokinase family protein, partial [Trichococcus flocculiformis]|nr:GTP pyrophosphokinase family protein [Trichococcus flocculiformis]